MENKSNNDKMYAQREILGIDEFSVIHRFTRVVLISENLVKFKFNENWDENAKKYKENITGFIKTINKIVARYLEINIGTNLSNCGKLLLGLYSFKIYFIIAPVEFATYI